MAGPRGLQPLSSATAADVTVQEQPDPALIQGGSADPYHAQGTVQNVYPWYSFPAPFGSDAVLGPFGANAGLISADPENMPAGTPGQDPRGDLTPDTHAAPGITTGVRDGATRDLDWASKRAMDSADIHASNTGASREIQYEDPTPMQKSDVYTYDTAGESALAPGVPNQLKGFAAGGPSTDRVQGFATQNKYGFDGAHVYQRFLRPGVPGLYMWMRPGARPIIIEPHGNTNTFDGPGSNFTGSGLQKKTRTVQGGILMNTPQEYTQPPEPVIGPADPADSPVAWGWEGF